MSLKESASISVGYPINGAKFINNVTVMVVGGGGEGRHGVPNCFSAIKCSFKVKDPKMILQKFRHVSLPEKDDAPQCVDTVKLINEQGDKEYNIIFGCNQNSQLSKSMGINCNVRKYNLDSGEHMRFVDAAQFEQAEIVSEQADEYPRAVKLSSDNIVGCFLTTAVPSSVFIFNPDTLELNFKYKPERDIEIKDVGLSPDKLLCYITSNSIETVSTSTGVLISSTVNNASLDKKLKGYIFSRMKFINEHEIIIGASIRGAKGAVLLHYNIQLQKIIKVKKLSNKFNLIGAFDISHKQDLIGVAGNDCSLTLVRLSDFNILGRFENLHSFVITSVTFSPDGTKLATGSASSILHVFNIPKNYGKSASIIGTLFEYLISIILIAAFAVFLQRVHTRVQFDQLIINSKQSFTLENTKEIAYGVGNRVVDVAGCLKNYGHKGIEFIKEKIQGENIDGDEETSKYFTMSEWNDGIIGTTTESTIIDRVAEVTKNIDEYTRQHDFDSETFLNDKDNYIETSIIDEDTSNIMELSSSVKPESSIESSEELETSVPLAVTPPKLQEPVTVLGNDNLISSEQTSSGEEETEISSSSLHDEKIEPIPSSVVSEKSEVPTSSVVSEKSEVPTSSVVSEKSEVPTSSVISSKKVEPSSIAQEHEYGTEDEENYQTNEEYEYDGEYPSEDEAYETDREDISFEVEDPEETSIYQPPMKIKSEFTTEKKSKESEVETHANVEESLESNILSSSSKVSPELVVDTESTVEQSETPIPSKVQDESVPSAKPQPSPVVDEASSQADTSSISQLDTQESSTEHLSIPLQSPRVPRPRSPSKKRPKSSRPKSTIPDENKTPPVKDEL